LLSFSVCWRWRLENEQRACWRGQLVVRPRRAKLERGSLGGATDWMTFRASIPFEILTRVFGLVGGGAFFWHRTRLSVVRTFGQAGTKFQFLQVHGTWKWPHDSQLSSYGYWRCGKTVTWSNFRFFSRIQT
jgi:hypothetical protein